jgi:hypothetical protein
MTNSEIIEIAALVLAVDQGKAEGAVLQQALDRFTDRMDHSRLFMATKLMEKGRFQFNSDNPESIRLMRSLAEDMGAMVEDVSGEDTGTSLFFTLPSKS